MTARPRIALISATPAAIAPAVAGLADVFPDAEVWNLLDDRLLPDLEAAGRMTPELEARMRRLIGHAVDSGADGVLLTCSQYGPVAEAATAAVPVLAPDGAAFRAVAEGGYGSVLVLASLDSALADTTARLAAFLAHAGSATELSGAVSADALAATRTGDTEALAHALLAVARGTHADAVLLAQFSLAGAAEPVAAELGIPVITGPHTAATRLRDLVAGA